MESVKQIHYLPSSGSETGNMPYPMPGYGVPATPSESSVMPAALTGFAVGAISVLGLLKILAGGRDY